MKKLPPDWVTQGLLYLEHKKYLLLAYLKWVATNFDEQRLYPFLSDLTFHYRNLLAILKGQTDSQNAFPAKISKLDLKEFKVEYERIAEDPEYLEVILQVL